MSDTCWWHVDAQGTLTIAPAFGKFGDLADWGTGTPPWYGSRASIKSVVVKGYVKARTATCMFGECSQLTSVSLTGLNITEAASLAYMFQGCSALGQLDMSGLKAASATNMTSMFAGCTALADLQLPARFDVEAAIGQDAFKDCGWEPPRSSDGEEPAADAQAASVQEDAPDGGEEAPSASAPLAEEEADESSEAVDLGDAETPLASGAQAEDEAEDAEEALPAPSWALAAALLAVAALLVVLAARLHGNGRGARRDE